MKQGEVFPKADLIEKMANALKVDYSDFFKIEHLQNRKTILDKINSLLELSTDEQLSKIFKLINSYLN